MIQCERGVYHDDNPPLLQYILALYCFGWYIGLFELLAFDLRRGIAPQHYRSHAHNHSIASWYRYIEREMHRSFGAARGSRRLKRVAPGSRTPRRRCGWSAAASAPSRRMTCCVADAQREHVPVAICHNTETRERVSEGAVLRVLPIDAPTEQSTGC